MANQNENPNVIGVMTNLADSGQDEFVQDWTEMAKQSLYEQGISNKYLNSDKANTYLLKLLLI